jgi:hypothetical protein
MLPRSRNLHVLFRQLARASWNVFFLGIFLASATPAWAVTRYVNSDSNGTASNPTRAFNDPSYTANDSYQTFTAANAAASNGDVIEFSGGTVGKTYVGHTAAISKTLTIQGSLIANHDAEVTINYNSGGGTYTLGLSGEGSVLQRVTISRQGGTSGQYGLRIFDNDITVRDVIVENTTGFGLGVEPDALNSVFENLFVDSSTIAGSSTMLVSEPTTIRNAVFHGVDIGGVGGISFQTDSGTQTLQNVVFDGIASGSILVTSGTTVNMTNCVITGAGINTARSIHFNSAGTVNTTNSFLQGSVKSPHDIISGTGTWNSTNDMLGEFPYYTRTKPDLGYLLLSIDDRHNIDHFVTLADYAKDNYGITMTFYVHDTHNLTAGNKTALQQLYLDGHEVALHTRHHTNMGVTGPMTVTYTGAHSNIAFVVSSNGTSLSVTGSGDTQGPLNLAAAANDTVGELCTIIEGWANYTCALTGTVDAPTKSEMPSFTLKDASTSLPISGATTIPYDDNTGASNRYMTEEITNGISDLEAAMDENGATAAHEVKTFAYPYSLRRDFTTTWIEDNTDLISVRSVSGDSIQSKTPLENIDIFSIGNLYDASHLEGTGYDALSEAEKQARIEKAARNMVTFASLGMVAGYVGHNPSQDLTVQEFEWLIDEIAVYADIANVEVKTHAEVAEDITTSGDWADQGTGFWTRTFSGSADYRPRYQSLMINAGVTASGRTDDILDNPLVGTPDIGAYEFQAPSAPASLAQYKSDGSTVITSAAWTNETTVVLKFNMSSSENSSDLLTPQVEVRTNATSFTNVATHTGSAVEYTGSPVLGTVTVTGLSSNSVYHWQASTTNEAGTSTWTTMGGSPDFGVDTTAPTTPGTPSTTTPTSDTTPTWTWAASTDAGSGLASPAYTVEWSTDSGFSGITGSSTAASTTFTHSTPLAQGTWYFRVRATDAQGNVSSNSSTGSAVVDTTAPTTPGTPSTTTPTADTTPTWTWTASTDAGSGLASPAYTVEWSTDSGFSGITGSATAASNTYTHTVALAEGTSYFRVRATDAAANVSSNSSTGSVLVDTTAPTTPGTPSTTTPTSDTTPTWTWSASTDGGSGLASQAYTVQWSTDSGFSGITGSATAASTTYTHTVTLADGTWYFRVRATDAVGNESSFSSTGSAVVDLEGPIISSIAATPTDTTVEITWTTDEASSSQINYGTTISYGSDTALEDTSPRVTSHSVEITGLTDCTEYHYRVRSIDSVGNESVSTDETFTTTGCLTPTPTPSPTPTASTTTSSSSNNAPGLTQAMPPVCTANPPATAPSVVISAYGPNSVTLSWSRVDPVTHYGLYFRRNSDGAEYGASNIGQVSSYEVNNLGGQESYTFEIFGINDCAPGSRGQVTSQVLAGGNATGPVAGRTRTETASEIIPVLSGATQLKVKVIDSLNQPIANLRVTIPTANNASAVTDARGIATFGEVPLGPQTLQTEFAGQTVTDALNVDGKRPNETVIFRAAEQPSPTPSAQPSTSVGSSRLPWVVGGVGVLFLGLAGLYLYSGRGQG